jgi:hypothetical protein
MKGMNEKNLDSYEDSDRVLLISLLDEYAKKISDMCDKVENLKIREKFILAGLAAYFGTISALFWRFPFIHYDNSTLPAALITVGVLISFLSRLITYAKKRKRLVHHASLLAKKLERTIQILSQVHDHRVVTMSSRLEIDFRLTEAEQSLDYARTLGIGEKVKGRYP